jgi:hypothetical protein
MRRHVRTGGCCLAIALAAAVARAEAPAGSAGLGSAAATVSAPSLDERLEYGWRVQGFFGALAGLFFPSHGEGSLTRKRLGNGNIESELWITSSADGEPDFYRYGAETHGESGATVRAWSSQLWRGKRKEKSSPVAEAGVVDVASAIQRLRAERPDGRDRLEIWSDGKLYPVEVRSAGNETVEVAGGKVVTQHLTVRPLTEPGRRVWKGELDLWLAHDPAATPVRILVSRPPARVLLELTRYP